METISRFISLVILITGCTINQGVKDDFEPSDFHRKVDNANEIRCTYKKGIDIVFFGEEDGSLDFKIEENDSIFDKAITVAISTKLKKITVYSKQEQEGIEYAYLKTIEKWDGGISFFVCDSENTGCMSLTIYDPSALDPSERDTDEYSSILSGHSVYHDWLLQFYYGGNFLGQCKIIE